MDIIINIMGCLMDITIYIHRCTNRRRDWRYHQRRRRVFWWGCCATAWKPRGRARWPSGSTRTTCTRRCRKTTWSGPLRSGARPKAGCGPLPGLWGQVFEGSRADGQDQTTPCGTQCSPSHTAQGEEHHACTKVQDKGFGGVRRFLYGVFGGRPRPQRRRFTSCRSASRSCRLSRWRRMLQRSQCRGMEVWESVKTTSPIPSDYEDVDVYGESIDLEGVGDHHWPMRRSIARFRTMRRARFHTMGMGMTRSLMSPMAMVVLRRWSFSSSMVATMRQPGSCHEMRRAVTSRRRRSLRRPKS